MRIDKYLKVSRILKRRTVAKELIESQRVLINNKIAKPSTEVNVGDLVTVRMGTRELTVKVLEVREVIKKNESADLYEVFEQKKLKEEEK